MADSLFYNPQCSKSRTADAVLGERGVAAAQVRYLEAPPTVEDLRRLMGLLGIDDPREMIRAKEPIYDELGLADGSAERLLSAVAEHPILLERPIFVRDGRAVIARPPERVLELLDD